MSCVPIQEIQDAVVCGVLISVSWLLVWYFPLGLIVTIPVIIYYIMFVPRITDSTVGYIVYQSRWEQLLGKTWQRRFGR